MQVIRGRTKPRKSYVGECYACGIIITMTEEEFNQNSVHSHRTTYCKFVMTCPECSYKNSIQPVNVDSDEGKKLISCKS